MIETEEKRADKLGFVGVLALILLFHLWQGWVIPLMGDEAYYHLWGARLQWGYYDHPPMIGWWIWLGEAVISPPLGTRLLPIFAQILTSLPIYGLLREIGASRALARRGALLCQMPFISVTDGGLAAPDAAASLFWSITLFLVARAARTGTMLSWLLAGLAAGLCLLSKLSGLFLIAGIGLWLVICRPALLRTSGPWLAFLAALAIFSPNIAWNAGNGFPAFASQFGRVAPDGFFPIAPLRFLASQLRNIHPVIAIMLVAAFVGMARGRAASVDARLLIFTTIPFFLLLAVHSLTGKVHGHWTSPLMPVFAALAALAVGTTPRRTVVIVWASVLLPLLPYVWGAHHWHFGAANAAARVEAKLSALGWPELAERIETRAVAAEAGWVGVIHYIPTSLLSGMDSPRHLPVVQLTERRRYPPSHSSWRADVTKPGLILISSSHMLSPLDPADLHLCFSSVESIGEIARNDHGLPVETFRLYLVSAPRRDVLNDGCHLPSFRPSLGGARYLPSPAKPASPP